VNTDVGPAVGRRRLAVELRRLRTAAGLTIQDVARTMECSVGKVSRIETGLVTARIQDVREMLELYAVPAAERAVLLDLVRESRKKAWWHAYSDVVPPESAKFYGLEDGAATIQEYGSVLVPGLLQTESYAAAVMSAAQDGDPHVEQRRLELRTRRQQLLTREHPPSLEVILHEPVLHNTMTGTDVTAAQLDRLVELARKPHISIRVLLMAAGPHEAAGMPFTIFGFAGQEDPSVVYHEQPTRNSLIDKPGEVAWYERAFAQAAKLALSRKNSIDAMKRIARSLS
jgi:transcriptional regulator with XRE-family HTH domain